MQQAGFGFTKHHADPVEGESREWADEANGVYYYDNLVVLRSATEPAVLLEAGIILNPDEEERLQTREVRSRIAKSVEQGLQVCGVVSTELRPRYVWPESL
jgi:N-acetylmuramoyl-L-alanine amidase